MFEKYCKNRWKSNEREGEQDKRKNTKSWKGDGERVGGLCLFARFAGCVCLLILFLYVAVRFKFRIPAETGIYFGQSTYIYRRFQIWTTFFARRYSLLRDFDKKLDSINCPHTRVFGRKSNCWTDKKKKKGKFNNTNNKNVSRSTIILNFELKTWNWIATFWLKLTS